MSGIQVTLGGVWKQFHEDKARLESLVQRQQTHLDTMSAECERLRRTSEIAQRSADNCQKQYTDLRAEHDAVVVALHEERRRREAAESRAEKLQRSVNEHETLEQSLHSHGSELADRVLQLQRRLDERDREVDHLTVEANALQRQYDQMERRFVHSEHQLSKERENVELLTKAKQQKEDHIVLLIKEKDRLYRQLTHTRSLLTKSMANALDESDLTRTPGVRTPSQSGRKPAFGSTYRPAGRSPSVGSSKRTPGSARSHRASTWKRTPSSATRPLSCKKSPAPPSGLSPEESVSAATARLATPKRSVSRDGRASRESGRERGDAASPWQSTLRDGRATSADATPSKPGEPRQGAFVGDGNSSIGIGTAGYEELDGVNGPRDSAMLPSPEGVHPPSLPGRLEGRGFDVDTPTRRMDFGMSEAPFQSSHAPQASALGDDERKLLLRRVARAQEQLHEARASESTLESQVRKLQEQNAQLVARYRMAVRSPDTRTGASPGFRGESTRTAGR